MFSEDLAARQGLLQRLDPRVKLLGLIVLLVAAGLARHVSTLAAVYLAALVLAVASRLPVRYFVGRVWLFVPIFTGIVMVPATLSVVTPGDVVLPLWHWHESAEGFTVQGLTAAALVVARVATSISLVLLVTVTTRWTRLLQALRGLGVPRMFVLIIGMAYRYVFLLLGTVTDMFQARAARTLGHDRHDRSARRFVGASAGALLGKAHHLSAEVHQAMVSRGYLGDAVTLNSFSLTRSDIVAALVVAAVAVGIVAGDISLGR